MKLNLGCGEFYADGWVNIDWCSPHRKDIEADIRQPLPLGGNVTHAYLGHILEHFTFGEAHQTLKLLHEVMTGDGVVMVVGPDVNRAHTMHAAGTLSAEELHGAIHGAQRWPGDAHLWKCEPDLLRELLASSGWSQVTEVPILQVPDDWPVASRTGWQCAVSAVA